MKIAHIVWGMTTGGIETMLVNIANEQFALGHDVHVIVINDLVDESLVESFCDGVRIFKLRRHVGSKNPLPIIRLNLHLSHIKPDVVHCHALNIPRFLAKKYVKRSCTTLHTICHEEDLRYVADNHRIFAISNSVADDLERRSAAKSTVVFNGIKSSLIAPRAADKPSGTPFRIVQVGRLNHAIKGQHVLINALSMLKSRNIDAVIDFIGEGPSLNFLESLVAERDLGNRVNFLGKKSQSYIFEHLCDYDLFAQPSIYEGFGLTIAEAMAAKVPTLISDIPAMLEVSDNGRYAAVFPSEDAEACADAIERIMQEDSSVMTDAAYARVQDLYDVRATARRYVELYLA